MKDRGTAAVAWLALIIALITFSMVVISRDVINQREVKALERIADSLEEFYGYRRTSQK